MKFLASLMLSSVSEIARQRVVDVVVVPPPPSPLFVNHRVNWIIPGDDGRGRSCAADVTAAALLCPLFIPPVRRPSLLPDVAGVIHRRPRSELGFLQRIPPQPRSVVHRGIDHPQSALRVAP